MTSVVDAAGEYDVRADVVGLSKVVPRFLLTLCVVDGSEDGCACICCCR
jgi:hypothetical protein